MQAQRGSRGIALLIINFGARLAWVVNATPRPLQPGENRPGTHCTGGWVGPRASLDGLEKIKISFSFTKPTKSTHKIHSSIVFLSLQNDRNYCAIFREFSHQVLKLAKI
jgi:hypothetical protein